MQIEKYSDRLKTLVQSAQSLAMRHGHQQITPVHVLKALLDDEERLAALRRGRLHETKRLKG